MAQNDIKGLEEQGNGSYKEKRLQDVFSVIGHDHPDTFYFPWQMTVVSGTLDSGNIDSLDSSHSEYVVINEGTGNAPNVTFDFANVASFATVALRAYYHGSVNHHVNLEVYNVTNDAWDILTVLGSQSDYSWYIVPVFDWEHYINGSSAVQLRIRHVESGISGHILNIDYLCIKTGGTGGGGVTDHGALSGLADDDHPQYLTSDRLEIKTARYGLTYDDLVNGYLVSEITMISAGTGQWIDLMSVFIYRPELDAGYTGGTNVEIYVGNSGEVLCTIPFGIFSGTSHEGGYKAQVTYGACGDSEIRIRTKSNFTDGANSNQPIQVILTYRQFTP